MSTNELFVHHCHCGKWGAFGYGVCLLKDKEGEWFCINHKPPKEFGKHVVYDRPGYQLMERKRE